MQPAQSDFSRQNYRFLLLAETVLLLAYFLRSLRKCRLTVWQIHVFIAGAWIARVLGYRSGGPGSITGTTRKNVVSLERGPLSLVSTTEELLDRKVSAPV
jgi:hypothetical protein